jgi:hypothetical protein
LGTNGFDRKNYWQGLWAYKPQRLGIDSDWADIFSIEGRTYFQKTDDSLWIQWNGNQKQKIELEPGFSVGRTSPFEHGKWRGTKQIQNNFKLGVRDDGTFRIWAYMKFNNQSHTFDWTEENLQFGKDTNWLSLAGHGEKIVTLKNDGTLWLWNFHHDNRGGWDTELDGRKWLDAKPIRLGTHSDWVAIDEAMGGIVSLAADGSLWFWRFEPNYSYLSHDIAFVPLLDISRKPQRIAGIFDKTN